jgi:hypothetical protein
LKIENRWKTWNDTDKHFWIGWVVSCSLGWLLVLGLYLLEGLTGIDSDPARREFPPLEHIFVENTIFCAFIPCFVAGLQWLLLGSYIRTWSWWIPLWVVASIMGWTGVITLGVEPPPDLSPAVIWIVGGLLTGILQWLVLQPYHPRAIWWPAAQLGSILIALTLSSVIPILAIVAGTLYGACSGYMIVALFHNPARYIDPPSRTTRSWFWRKALPLLLFCGLVTAMLMSFRYWRMLWYLTPPPPPIFASAADVITKNVGGRGDIALVVRFPPPARGHQEQVAVLEATNHVYREPADAFWLTLRSAQLTPEQENTLNTLRRRWCSETPTFQAVRIQEPFYDVGLWCRTEHVVKGIQIPSDQLPPELEVIVNTVAGPDSYE